jgi:hypothetical protein
MNKTEFIGKKIKCVWCDNYSNSVCSVKKQKIKARKGRRCADFIPNEDALQKEANRGKDTGVKRRPDWYWMTRAEKKAIMKRREEAIREALSGGGDHPLTGDLSRFKTTAE